MMKVLFLSSEAPVPPLTGGRERTRRILLHLARQYEVRLVTFAAAEEQPALIELGESLAGVTTIPYASRSDQASPVMLAAVKKLREDWLPDLIHVAGWDLWRYAPAGPQRVLDLPDVPAVLHQRLGELQSSWARPLNRLKVAQLRRWQGAILDQADAIIVTSDEEKAALEASSQRVLVLPNGVDLDHWAPTTAQSDPATVLFPGALNWRPNIDAAKVLIRRVLPLLQVHVPAVRVMVAGRLPDPSVSQWAAENPAVTLVPNPVNMVPLFAQATVVAVPLRAGGGTRLKILQALAVGRPVVSTPLGAEGLELESGRHLLVESLTQPFVQAVADLLTDSYQCTAITQAGLEVIGRYAWERQLSLLDELYAKLAEEVN